MEELILNWLGFFFSCPDESETVIKFDRSTLPTAPKAAMGPKYNEEDIPRDGPFSAHLGNVSYDAQEHDLESFFSELNVREINFSPKFN